MTTGVNFLSDSAERDTSAVESANIYGHPAAVELAERLYAEACGRTKPRMPPFLEDAVQH